MKLFYNMGNLFFIVSKDATDSEAVDLINGVSNDINKNLEIKLFIKRSTDSKIFQIDVDETDNITLIEK